MRIRNHPFKHLVIDNFLTTSEYDKIFSIYNNLQFHEKHTDLFHFFQSNELNGKKELNFFVQKILQTIENTFEKKKTIQQDAQKTDNENHEINQTCQQKVKPDKIWFNVFASYYKEGNYLLCHDDLIEDRKYAFSYYLEDFDSGELILYNKTADKEQERLKVKKNRIAIFEVNEISFHEVNFCKETGRKAFTGWYNVKNQEKKESLKFEKFKFDSNYEFVDICDEIVDDCMLMEIGEYDFDFSKKALVGPFTERKVSLLKLNAVLVPIIADLKFIEANIYEFHEHDYILLGEKTQKTNIYDVFIMSADNEEMNGKEFITYINSKGDKEFDLVFENDSLYCVKRNDLNFFVPLTQSKFRLAHFVFEKENSN